MLDGTHYWLFGASREKDKVPTAQHKKVVFLHVEGDGGRETGEVLVQIKRPICPSIPAFSRGIDMDVLVNGHG